MSCAIRSHLAPLRVPLILAMLGGVAGCRPALLELNTPLRPVAAIACRDEIAFRSIWAALTAARIPARYEGSVMTAFSVPVVLHGLAKAVIQKDVDRHGYVVTLFPEDIVHGKYAAPWKTLTLNERLGDLLAVDSPLESEIAKLLVPVSGALTSEAVIQTLKWRLRAYGASSSSGVLTSHWAYECEVTYVDDDRSNEIPYVVYPAR